MTDDHPLARASRDHSLHGASASLVALERTADGRARDDEEVADLGGAVLAGAVQADEVDLLARVERASR